MESSLTLENNDCTDLFKQAYENRYTWGDNFNGYQGECILEYENQSYKAEFAVSKELNVIVDGLIEEKIKKEIESQLWEVAIHRVRRTFQSVHGLNTFIAGDINELGQEVLVGGKNKGDKYRVKDNVVTMVNRHIHGNLIMIYTTKIIDTGLGYLSKAYNSQYFNPKTNIPKGPKSYFIDEFSPLTDQGLWFLSKRQISLEPSKDIDSDNKNFIFNNINVL